MAYKPVWKNRGGSNIDMSSMSKIAELRVAELTPFLETSNEELAYARDKVDELEKQSTEAAEQLAYWQTMRIVAKEIDERLQNGEEVTDVDAPTVDRPVE